MIKSFRYRIANDEERKVTEEILAAALPGRVVEFYSIPQHSPDRVIEDGDIVITFGNAARLLVTQSDKAIQHIALPMPIKLLNVEGNETTRVEAWDQLMELAGLIDQKAFAPSDVTISEDDMPDLDAKHLLVLKELIKKSGSKVCFQTAKNGKIIAICYEKPSNVEADIYISFEELYTIRQIMDILDVDNVKLVNLK